jgi:hypothetical protein
MGDKDVDEFERLAAAQSPGNFLTDCWSFLWSSKKWWLTPVLVLLLLFGLLFLLAPAAAPFIYTLF